MKPPSIPGATRALLVLGAALAAWGAVPAPLPPIVFVSRLRAYAPGVVPGLGPAGRALKPGGRLMLREPDGRVRALLPNGALWDVSDPSVSPDARQVVFAGTVARDSAWRIYRLTLADGRFERLPIASPPGADDLDPCWIGPRSIVFASTRGARVSQYARIPVTNLWRWDFDGRPPRALTFERNGAEEPCRDPVTGRVLFSRWWFNRHQPADSGGLIEVRAGDALAERANLWHVMSVTEQGGDERLTAGRMTARRTAMGYQATVLAGGDVLATFALHTGMFPTGGAYGIQRLDRAGARSERIAGTTLENDQPVGYGGTGGLASPSACAPAALPGGRIVFAFDPAGRGDFGLVTSDDHGRGRVTLVDLPGTLELDPAPVVTWAVRDRPLVAERGTSSGTFRYRNRDVFAGAGAPARTSGARLRFFQTLDRPDADGGDSVVMVREVGVPRSGLVDERELPAGVPMFEQLLDAHGRTLQGPLGPAHVLGLNVGSPGATATCRGCHVGHSRLK